MFWSIGLKILMEAWENSEEIKLVDAGQRGVSGLGRLLGKGTRLGMRLIRRRYGKRGGGRGLGRVGRLLL